MRLFSKPTDQEEILVVEDSPTQALQIRHFLEQQQYKVTTVNSGRQALDFLKTHQPALIITDIIMLEMNGYELCRRIKAEARSPDIPVILLTALSNPEDVLEILACGADSFISKPCLEKHLLVCIQQLLANTRRPANEQKRVKLEIPFGGKRHVITASHQQALTLLLSTYEAAVQHNAELTQAQAELRALNAHLEELIEARTAALSAEIAERQQTEARLRRYSRVYAVLSEVNQAIVRVRQPQVLFETICRIAVEQGGFRMAWIGLLDPQTQRVTPAAWAGATGDYLEKLNVTLADTARGRGPTAAALRTGTHIVANDIANDPRMLPWRADALRLGYRASAAFPLSVAGEARGTLNLYAAEPDFFDEAELQLLDELAADIAFALQFAEQEAKRTQAEAALRESETNFRTLAENASEGILIAVAGGRHLFVNHAMAEISGYSADELLNLRAEALAHPDEAAQTAARLVKRLAGEPAPQHYETAILGKSGRKIPVQISANKTFWKGQPADIVFVQDITERRRAELALKLSEDKFLKAFQASPDAILISRLADGRLAEVNDGFCRLAEYTRAEALASSTLNLGLWADPPDREQCVAALREHGQVSQLEFRFCTKSGGLLDCLYSGAIIHLGDEAHVLSVIRDITARKRAEEALKKSEEKYRLLHESMIDGFVSVAMDGRILDYNAIYRDMLGYTAAELAQLTYVDITPEKWHAYETGLVENQVLKRGYSDVYEKEYLKKDGSLLPVELHVVLTRTEQGEPAGMWSIVRDITERKRTEGVLNRRAAQLALLNEVGSQIAANLEVETVLAQAVHLAQQKFGYQHVGIFTLDNARTRLVQRAKAGLFSDQFPAEHTLALGQGIVGWVGQHGTSRLANDVQADPDYINRYPDTIPTQAEASVPLCMGDKVLGVLDVQSSHRNAFDENDLTTLKILADQIAVALENARLYQAAQRELAERKLAEHRLEKQAQELARSNVDLEQFAYIVSHDLQEPLRMVSSYVQLLERRYKDRLDADANEFIAYAVEGAQRMHELLRDLVAYSRVNTRAQLIASTSSEQILRQALDNLQLKLLEYDAVVTHSPLPQVRADGWQLMQVFQNLIENAVKFRSAAPPRVQVTASQKAGAWEFAVQDNGLGIDPRSFERIFKIFQRLHSQTEYPGTGIGLAICRRIVERHGGRIWVESQPGQGATFYFTLPD